MRRRYVSVCLIAAVVTLGTRGATAEPFRFPEKGAHAFHGDLPKGWRSKTDTRGGMLLVAPGERALIYLAIVTDETLRGKPDRAVAEAVAKIAGIEGIAGQGPARISSASGSSLHRGSAFSGVLPAKHGLARKVKIIIFRLAPATWAQVWTVTQPGLNPVESDALDRALNGLTLASVKN